MPAQKLKEIPANFSPALINGQVGLYRDTHDGGEWLVSASERDTILLKGLLRVLFEEDAIPHVYQEIVSQISQS